MSSNSILLNLRTGEDAMRRLVASTLIVTLLTMICAPTASGQEIGEVDAPKHEKTVVAPVIGEDASALSCLAKGKYDARALAPVSDPDLGHFRQPCEVL